MPLSDDIRSDTTPGGIPSMVNFGVAESYLNHASFGIFDSGMLCIGATPALAQQLSTGFFSLAVPSLDAVAFPIEDSAIAMQLRPQTPPQITVGEAPLLDVVLDDLEIDFYVFTRDRYVRFMTVKLDMTIPIDLQIDEAGITPSVGDVGVAEVSVSNSRLLADDATDVAKTFEALVGIAVDMFIGGLNPFALPDLLGFTLDVPDGGITMTESGGERFLSIFANLEFAAGGAATFAPETTAELEALEIDPTAYDLGEGWQERMPVAHLRFAAAAPGDVEYSYRVDGGTWSLWSPQDAVALDAPHFVFKGRHLVEVRSRLAGIPRSADPTPAEIPLLIDTRAPRVTLIPTDAGWEVDAFDIVSPDEDLEVAWKIEGGEWSAWGGDLSLADLADVVAVRVRDEAGNVTETSSGEVAGGIIRGGPSTTGGGTCSCRVAGSGGPSGAGILLGAGLLGLVLLRRRRGAVLLAVLLPFALTAAGCDCGGRKGGNDSDAGPGNCEEAECDADQVCCEDPVSCIDVPDLPCDPGFACEDDVAGLFDPATCTFPEACENCVELPPLEPGIIGDYTDFAVTGDGTIWVSGYARGDVEGRESNAWGDLVVGTFQTESSEVGWEIVDGVPADGKIVGSVNGWRGGIEDPGDDVGLYTSIAVTAAGDPRVTYYDVTNGDLKFASLSGASWSVQVVDDEGDAGKWSSIALLAGGVPAATYVEVRPDTAVPGGFLSALRFARADAPEPTSWDIADVAVQPTECLPQWCAAGEACLDLAPPALGTCVADEGDACGDCAGGETCVAGACAAIRESAYVGDWQKGYVHSSLAMDPVAGQPVVAFYDRQQGNAMISTFDGAAWGAPTIIDGFDGVTDTCDCGLAISLFVDASGVRHAAYVNGWPEEIKYWSSASGAEVIDARGFGLTGDDASIAVTPGGEVRVAYQDATDGLIRWAVRTAPGAWTTETLDVLPSAEAFPFHVEQIWDGAASQIGSWWGDFRAAGGPQAGVVVVAP